VRSPTLPADATLPYGDQREEATEATLGTVSRARASGFAVWVEALELS